MVLLSVGDFMQILIWLISIPFLASAITFVLPVKAPGSCHAAALPLSLVPLFFLIFFHGEFIGTSYNVSWMPAVGINFHLAIDNLSLVFLYLTALVIPLSLSAASKDQLASPHLFYSLVFLLEGFLFVFFTAQDLAVFTFFWEAMLLPLYFIISLWGKPNSQAAALKFLIYMIAGSCLMVAAVLFLYFSNPSPTFDIKLLSSNPLPYAAIPAAIFLLAFAVKTPLFPFHAWLPDAYYQASVPGTILLSAILSKAGIYGIFRVGLGVFPSFVVAWSPILVGLAIIGVLYAALAAWRQTDFKRLLAYSSLSHVNFVLAGVFIWSQVSYEGAVLQSVNHGITIAALFLAAGWLEERVGTTSMGGCGGLAKYLPMLCWVTFLFVLSSVALPATNNFVGEILILFGAFKLNPWLALVLGLSVILSVIYMLRMMQKVYFETPAATERQWTDLRVHEWIIAAPLIVLILWIGIYPSPVLRQITPAVEGFFAVEKGEGI